jgi:hypothetical protein
MTTFLQKLAAGRATTDDGVFVAITRYYAPMDYLLYLTEDVSYRADRVDEFLTVLWHPYEDRLIGLKFKGFRVLLRQVKAALGLQERDYLSLVTLLTEAALSQATAKRILDAQETDRQNKLRRRYHLAMDFARAASVSAEEMKKAA